MSDFDDIVEHIGDLESDDVNALLSGLEVFRGEHVRAGSSTASHVYVSLRRGGKGTAARNLWTEVERPESI